MAREHPEVCRVHFGLLKGVLEQTDGPLSADALHPFVEQNTCTLDISRTDYESMGPERDPAVTVAGTAKRPHRPERGSLRPGG